MKTIETIYKELESTLDSDDKLNEIINYLSLTINKIFASTSVVSKGKIGYCMIFIMESDKIASDLIKKLNINASELRTAFETSWGLPPDKEMVMYKNSFYHILLLLVAYSMRKSRLHPGVEKYRTLGELALKLILMRIWNGRLRRAIKFCNPDIMDYVINNMVTKKMLVSKYSSPYELISKYFVPTIYDAYKDKVVDDLLALKAVFTQAHNRMKQIFYQNYHDDPLTGKTVALGGLASLYYKAYEEGKRMSTTVGDTSSESQLDKVSYDTLAAIVDDVVNDIMMFVNKDYSEDFIKFLTDNFKISRQSLEAIINELHSSKYEEDLRDVVSKEVFILKDDLIKQKVCSPTFLTSIVKMKMISSKNTPQINSLNNSIGSLIDKILKSMGKTYDQYSSSRRLHLRNIMIYLIAYNIQRQMCTHR